MSLEQPCRRNTLSFALLMWFGCMSLSVGLLGQTPKAPSKPNVLLILADDLGWRDTSVYGSTFYQTPHIDELAASGMRFNNSYSANPLCSPTRASILTGQYPMRHGLTAAGGHVLNIHKHREQFFSQPEIRGCGPSTGNNPHEKNCPRQTWSGAILAKKLVCLAHSPAG